MIRHVLGEMFGWPTGNVIGNLLASALWAPLAFVHLHIKLNRHRRELTAEKGLVMNLPEILHALVDAVRITDTARGDLHTAINGLHAVEETVAAAEEPDHNPEEPQRF